MKLVGCRQHHFSRLDRIRPSGPLKTATPFNDLLPSDFCRLSAPICIRRRGGIRSPAVGALTGSAAVADSSTG